MIQSIGIGVFLLIMGLAASIIGRKLLKLKKRVRKFRTVVGNLLEKGIQEKKLGSATGPRNTHVISLIYEFEVNGKPYKGHNYYPSQLIGGERAMTPKEAQKKLDVLPENVDVFYDPEDPNQNYIHKTMSIAWLILTVGWLILLGGIMQLLVIIPE